MEDLRAVGISTQYSRHVFWTEWWTVEGCLTPLLGVLLIAQFQLAYWSHISSGDWCVSVCVCVCLQFVLHAAVLTFHMGRPPWHSCLYMAAISSLKCPCAFLLKCCHLSCNVKQHVVPYIADQEEMVEGKISPDASAVVLDCYNLFVRKGIKQYMIKSEHFTHLKNM